MLQAMPTSWKTRSQETMGEAVKAASGRHHQLLSLLTTLALIKTLGCTRFHKAVKDGVKPPPALVQSLSRSLQVASDNALTVPGTLQALVLKFATPSPADPKRDTKGKV